MGNIEEDKTKTVIAMYDVRGIQKYIKRLPEKPVSCVKLREQYKQITAETGCNKDTW